MTDIQATKQKELKPLKAGILIVGSLYWEDTPIRRSWRECRLDAEAGFLATAPIRYGRLSESRDNTYTMVFSRGAGAGCAKVLPCRQAVSSAKDLIDEAEQLWTAERSAAKNNNRLSASWGSVGLLKRPGLELPKGFLEAWSERVSREKGYGVVPQTVDEGTLVSKSGLLNIDWPAPIDPETSTALDLILATATCPTLRGNPPSYPSPATIAEAWGRNETDRIAYFRNNRKNSITTFQDQEILAHLKLFFPALFAALSV
jgi:hypothetical protein